MEYTEDDDYEGEAQQPQPYLDHAKVLEELATARFSMPPAVIIAFRAAAKKGAERLLDLVEDDAKFSKLRPQDQFKLIEMIFDRAYGRSETASTSALTAMKTGQNGNSTSHQSQLEAIHKRHVETQRKQLAVTGRRLAGRDDTASQGGEGSVTGGLAIDRLYPELSGQSPRRNSPVTGAPNAGGARRGDVVPITNRRA